MDIHAKTVLAVLLLAVGFVATLIMFHLQGRGETVRNPGRLRGAHRAFGLVFFVLLVLLVFTGMRYVAWGRGEPSARSIIHVVLAAALVAVFVLKLLIARFYRGLLRYVSAFGMIVFVLTVLVFSASAGYYLARGGQIWGDREVQEREEKTSALAEEAVPEAVHAGAAVYERYCAFCHYAESTESKLGPGLKGVLRAETLPVSGRPATAENILDTLENPIGTMPAFTNLTAEELERLIAFLETI
ncbi:MAG TPA: cytochrome c [Candidatus Eisenbacteria bacterium]|uniref:Cytochrome c n=1 Tax=Eiseniibacteriota bacterium TaxID=2212470 RepID=A0A7V2AUT0_UNCEI|nr:cytochrome c [Candidatus Eisenbacteria bacterium]